MRAQKGYLFHKGPAWFLRYFDDVLVDGTVQRKQVCKKLTDVAYGGEFKTKKSVAPFVQKILTPLNAGTINPQSTMTVAAFVDTVYIPQHIEKTLRPASRKQARDTWRNHLKPRMGSLTLRTFRTVHGERMLAQIAEQAKLGKSSLKHCKSFLSGCFKQAKRLGILDGENPVRDVSVPKVVEAEDDTYAYDQRQIATMVAQLPEPARTVVLCAAFSGLRKSELRGLRWEDFTGEQLFVRRSVWNSTTSATKTKSSKAAVPVIRALRDALEAHRLRAGKLAQPDQPIFAGGTGKPANMDNLARRVIQPKIESCRQCHKPRVGHEPADAHPFELDESLPWRGWHAFRRGLATNLHALGVDDRTIQAILRHSDIRLTQGTYIKSLNESQVDAMDLLSEKFATCNESTTPGNNLVN